ncbi:MAG: ABC transporter permease [Acidobacteria bacterium]|nr:ABC transporter permease [Acidobacteriota bacterium]
MWRNLAALVRYRPLIQSLVARELKARYRGSVLGFFWSFVNPLLLLSIYTFVFTKIMPGQDERTQPYAVFFFSGLLPWTWFTTSLLEAASSLIAGGNLIKKVLFPAEILPIVSVLANMVHFVLGLIILVGFMIGTHHYPDPAGLPWFPVVVAIQLVFTLALALVLSALTVHFRDIRDLLSNLLTFWFFATPIIYAYFMPTVQSYRWLFRFNPFYHLVVSYQEILFFPGPFGHLRSLLIMGAASGLFFCAGYWLFDRLRDSFAESV